MRNLWNLLVIALLAVLAPTATAQSLQRAGGDEITAQERQCLALGWSRVTLNIAGLPRQLLWKGPAREWSHGTIIVMHGGGGQHFQWCVANAAILQPQVNFTNRAIAEGFAVFALNSSDQVTDNEGRLCGKAWDDEVRARPNLDLPFIEEVIRTIIPRVRPKGSRPEVFLTGLSSGGYMTVRAATQLDNLVTAFAPVSSGDPYGWHRICERGMTRRQSVHGAGFDNETNKQISEIGSCRAASYPNEKRWETSNPPVKPAFKLFRHEGDGINDPSCGEKVETLLRLHGYRDAGAFVLRGNGQRNLAHHLWQEDYNRPILEFFSSQLAVATR